VTAIVGWEVEDENSIERSYADFENKYSNRKSKGELKSSTVEAKQLKTGFSSLHSHNVEFIGDFFKTV